MTQYAPSLAIAWTIAATEAQAGNAPAIEPAHLLLGICKLCDLDLDELLAALPQLDPRARVTIGSDVDRLQRIFGHMGLDHTRFRRRLRELVAREVPARYVGNVVHRDDAARACFRRAEELSAGAVGKSQLVLPEHLLQALLEEPQPSYSGLLAQMGVARPAKQLAAAPQHLQPPTTVVEGEETPAVAAPRVDRAQATPYLDRFGRDLTRAAREKKLSPVIGREREIRSLARALTQKRKNSAILVGDAGVGKTAVVEGLAQWVLTAEAPAVLQDAHIVEVSMASLLAGTKYRGEFEERVQALISEASMDRSIVLFIDEIHTLMGAGGEGASDAANILKPALARGDLRCIGATTTTEYRRYIEADSALQRRFQLVWVEEPTREAALSILRGLRLQFQAHHGLTIGDDALEAAVDLSLRYLPDYRLPDKAIDAIDQACARAHVPSVRSDLPPSVHVGRADVAIVISQRAGVPVQRVAEDEAKRLLHMETVLRRRVKGQDEALRVVSDAVRTARAGLKNPRRPVGVFLFVGATGTGKTELAKALAEFLFDDEGRLIRIDMSEYMARYAVSRLIGAPPGYVGYDEEGQLTGPVRTHPYSVVLFDEVEKAHPDVLNLLLQVLDEGHLTDTHGRVASFTEAIIIMTSNLGGGPTAQPKSVGFAAEKTAAATAGFDAGGYRQQILDALQQHLRPELRNRIQETVFFYPLSKEALRRVVDKVLDGVCTRLKERKMELALSDEAYDVLITAGYDPAFGARELERAVERLLVQPLGKALLEGRFEEGAALYVTVRDRELVLQDAGGTRAAHLSRWHGDGSE